MIYARMMVFDPYATEANPLVVDHPCHRISSRNTHCHKCDSCAVRVTGVQGAPSRKPEPEASGRLCSSELCRGLRAALDGALCRQCMQEALHHVASFNSPFFRADWLGLHIWCAVWEANGRVEGDAGPLRSFGAPSPAAHREALRYLHPVCGPT